MSTERIFSAVLPLLVALFNLLAAGYALASLREDRTRLGFALGPLGVGLWAVAWFTSIFNPEGLVTFQLIGSFAGLVSVSGFAADALRDMGPLRAKRFAALVGALLVASVTGLALVLPRSDVLSFASMTFRVGCVALVGTLFAARALEWNRADPEKRDFARKSTVVLAVCGAVYLAVAGAALISDRTGVDPLLLTVLVAESMTLLYVLHRRVQVHILLSRAITYVILSLAVAMAAALLLRAVGYDVDLVLLATVVVIALLAAVLFMGLGELMTSGVERVLFPERARLTRALTVARDESALLRRRLERAEKLAIAGELAASVAHEIKNPLSPIRGYAQLLAGKLEHVDDVERHMFQKGLAIIEKESDRIDQRVGDLLLAARAEKTLASIDEELDLHRVLLEAIAVTEASGLSIVQKLEPDTDSVVGNEDEMRGAFVNLLKNAAEAMQDSSGEIVVEAHRAENKIVVEIRDEGQGLPPETTERVFEAFYTTKEEGTGLGMAIAKSAVEAAGGTLSLENRSDRQGAVARVELQVGRTG